MGAGEVRRIERQLYGCEATRRQRCLLCGNNLKVSPQGICQTCSEKISTSEPWTWAGDEESLAKEFGSEK
jgi:predicted amidophosphoribosyltransferase